ncbi:MAG: hypothetical protein LBG87_03955, partial [Spirochaetaceae bacterium]|nr:hypothetical protein [Spirochaetaceae bacterium]
RHGRYMASVSDSFLLGYTFYPLGITIYRPACFFNKGYVFFKKKFQGGRIFQRILPRAVEGEGLRHTAVPAELRRLPKITKNS